MATDQKSRPSFSPANRWKIGFDVVLRTALVIAVAVMVNFLGARFFQRFYLSSQTRVVLSSRTLTVLQSLTNKVSVTLYFDRKADFYPAIVALLDEYRAANKNISYRTVDYIRDASEAEKVKSKYNLNAATDKNLIIFDLAGRFRVAPGDAITKYTMDQVPKSDPNQKELEFRRRPVEFNGEMMFTTMLLALENPQPLKAYFLQGHGEPSLAETGEFGYSKFNAVLQQNYIAVSNLELTGDAPVPSDCNLLVIAAPSRPLAPEQLQKIDQYLRDGGRLLLLFSLESLKYATGLEPIVKRWGVNVVADIAQDRLHTFDGQDIITQQFGKHPVVNSLSQLSLQIVFPRPVEKINWAGPPANAPQVDELVLTSPDATLYNDRTAAPRSYSLACAVEQKTVAGVATPRGLARIIVVGDSIFVGNHYIESGGANRDFLNAAVNWLCDRPQLLVGIGPRPVTEFRLLVSQEQQRQLRWLLLGALPGGALFFGWLIWLIRRK
jgi:hypothetical protein